MLSYFGNHIQRVLPGTMISQIVVSWDCSTSLNVKFYTLSDEIENLKGYHDQGYIQSHENAVF